MGIFPPIKWEVARCRESYALYYPEPRREIYEVPVKDAYLLLTCLQPLARRENIRIGSTFPETNMEIWVSGEMCGEKGFYRH